MSCSNEGGQLYWAFPFRKASLEELFHWQESKWRKKSFITSSFFFFGFSADGQNQINISAKAFSVLTITVSISITILEHRLALVNSNTKDYYWIVTIEQCAAVTRLLVIIFFLPQLYET